MCMFECKHVTMASPVAKWDEEWENVAVKQIEALKAKREVLFKATKAFQTAQKDVARCQMGTAFHVTLTLSHALSARRLSKTRASC